MLAENQQAEKVNQTADMKGVLGVFVVYSRSCLFESTLPGVGRRVLHVSLGTGYGLHDTILLE